MQSESESKPVIPQHDWGFEGPVNVLVLGARGGVGEAFCKALLGTEQVMRVLQTSRDLAWCDGTPDDSREMRVPLDLTSDSSLQAFQDRLRSEDVPLHLIVNCTGILHGEGLRPERSWAQIERSAMQHAFDVHATGLALVFQITIDFVPRTERSVFASLSARIGSIDDNRLGGWFSYRASKAAQNMILKTASIEAARRWPKMTVVALHPGTVHSNLSAPFSKNLPPDRVFTPEQSVQHLRKVIAGLTPQQSGSFWAWDGSPISW